MKIKLLSFLVDCISRRDCVNEIGLWIKKKEKRYICVASLHLLTEGLEHEKIRSAINDADLMVPDGMPLVWALRWKGYKKAERIYGPDLMLRLCEEARRKKWRVGLLGGSSGQMVRLKKVLEDKYSDIDIVYTTDTPKRRIEKKENKRIVQNINDVKPNILFVGLGCPLQELWMAENSKKLNSMTLIGVGAAFNFLTGDVKQAPRWMKNVGLEWLFRASQEPVRLIPRYIHVCIVLLKYFLGFYKNENTSHS